MVTLGLPDKTKLALSAIIWVSIVLRSKRSPANHSFVLDLPTPPFCQWVYSELNDTEPSMRTLWHGY